MVHRIVLTRIPWRSLLYDSNDVYDLKVFIGLGSVVEVYDSAYRPIREIELEESFGYLTLKVLPGDRIALVNNNTDEIR